MKIAIDISPISNESKLSHRVRGTGFYIKNLTESLSRYYPEHSYIHFDSAKDLKSDVDVVHYPYFEPFFPSLPFKKLAKTVVTVHDLIPFVFPKHFPRGLRGEVTWQIQKRLLRRADAIITDSYASKTDIIAFTGIPEEKIHVIYLAAGENYKKKIDESIRDKYRLPKEYALYVGDATWNKNLPRLIKAAIKADVPLVMVGKALTATDYDRQNPWNKDLKESQELVKGSKLVKLLGFVPADDLVSLYSMAAVFVMPSMYEGFGLPLLEAMRCGCPVIISKEGSLKEVAGDAVFYVDPQSVDDIVGGIRKILQNKELQKNLSQQGLKQAKKFSWKKTAEETMKVYEEKN